MVERIGESVAVARYKGGGDLFMCSLRRKKCHLCYVILQDKYDIDKMKS